MDHTVHAVAHVQTIVKRLEVDVGRPEPDRIPQHLVDEADDRRVLGGLVEVRVVGAAAVVDDRQI